jgi:cobalt/nickel transport system permease protein
MHIPDGFLTPPVWATLDVAGLSAVTLVARRARAGLEESRLPLLGVMGAFVFAAQMINFPVGLGTSGHLVGGALLACILGPAPAALVMTAILAIQALLFQDGGIIALGANVLNMAIAGVFAGFLPYHFLGRSRPRLAVFTGAFLSVLVSALLAISELLLSGVRIPSAMVWISLALFVVSAVIEGIITVAVIGAIGRLQPAWTRPGVSMGSAAFVTLALAVVFLTTLGITIASASPDGLQQLAHQAGFAAQAKTLIESPFADYRIAGIGDGWGAKALAGTIGALVTLVVGLICFRSVRPRAAARSARGDA